MSLKTHVQPPGAQGALQAPLSVLVQVIAERNIYADYDEHYRIAGPTQAPHVSASAVGVQPRVPTSPRTLI